MSARSQKSRTPRVGPLRHLALAAALLLCAGLSGCTAADSTAAVPTAASSEVPPLPYEGDLDAGTYLATAFTVPFEITVPDGWSMAFGDLLEKELSPGMGVFLTFPRPTHVPADACAWSGTITQIGPSVDDFVDALATTASTTTTAPADVTSGGFSGVEFALAVESGIDITDCSHDQVCIHSTGSSSCSRYYQTVAQHETYRVFDLDGDRAVVTVGQWEADVDPALVEEARTVFDSIVFVPED